MLPLPRMNPPRSAVLPEQPDAWGVDIFSILPDSADEKRVSCQSKGTDLQISIPSSLPEIQHSPGVSETRFAQRLRQVSDKHQSRMADWLFRADVS